MAQRKSGHRRSPASLHEPAPAAHPAAAADAPSAAARIATAGVAIAIVAAGVAVDPWATQPFDAPKWLLVQLAALLTAAALLFTTAAPGPASRWLHRWLPWQRVVVLSLLLLVLLAVIATLNSVHQPLSWRVLLTMATVALFLPIGASAVLAGASGRRLLALTFVCGGATALLSLLQAMGLPLPIVSSHLGGRYPTGALLGNEGYVALLSTLIALAAVAILAAGAVTGRIRIWLVVLVVAAIVAIAVNRQATAAIALAFGLAVLAAARWRQQRIALALCAGLLVLVLSAMLPALRVATWGALPGFDGERWQQLTTYRLGGWVAAEEMVRTSPWIGHGPGSFAEESTRGRLDAEPRWRQRFLQPTGATFVFAHQDGLQLAAELGLPALLCAALGFAIVYLRLLRAACAQSSAERLLLLAVLTAGGVMSLAWFPLQIPLTAVLLLLAAGRAWRVAGEAEAGGAR